MRTEATGPAVEEDLRLGEFAESQGAVRAAKAACLATTKRCAGMGGGSDGLIDANHSGLKPSGESACCAGVSGPDACAKCEVTGVGRSHRRIRVGNRANQNNGAESTRQGMLCVGRVGKQDRWTVKPAGSVKTRTAGQNATTRVNGILDLAIETLRAPAEIMGPMSVIDRAGSPT